MSHTPGPWGRRTFKADAGEVLDGNGNWVARVHRRNNDEDEGTECFANTCLIAAAPELLAALERVEHHGCEGSSATECVDTGRPCWVCQAQAAILKAKGKGFV